MQVLKRGYRGLVYGENFLRHFLLLAIRLYWGGTLATTGLAKLMNISGVTEYFTSLNLPFPSLMAYAVGLGELLGGASLFVGFFSRIFSIVTVTIMIGAYVTTAKEALLNIFSKPSEFMTQDPFLFLYASLIILCFGPGMFSLDYWLEKRAFGKAL